MVINDTTDVHTYILMSVVTLIHKLYEREVGDYLAGAHFQLSQVFG
jgi:hypothetical protein